MLPSGATNSHDRGVGEERKETGRGGATLTLNTVADAVASVLNCTAPKPGSRREERRGAGLGITVTTVTNFILWLLLF